MKKFILMLATAVVVALPLSAQVELDGGFYVSGFGGGNFVPSLKERIKESGTDGHIKLHPRPGYFIGAAVGTKLDSFRLETEFCYRRNSARAKSPGHKRNRPHTEVYSVLVNGYYDIDFCNTWDLKPYLGAGIGWGHNDAKGHADQSGSRVRIKGKNNKFAWQLLAGLAYPVSNCVELGLEYRYFNSNVHKVHNHDVGAVVRYGF